MDATGEAALSAGLERPAPRMARRVRREAAGEGTFEAGARGGSKAGFRRKSKRWNVSGVSTNVSHLQEPNSSAPAMNVTGFGIVRRRSRSA